MQDMDPGSLTGKADNDALVVCIAAVESINHRGGSLLLSYVDGLFSLSQGCVRIGLFRAWRLSLLTGGRVKRYLKR